MVRSSQNVPRCCWCFSIKTGLLIYGIYISIESLISMLYFLIKRPLENIDLSHEGDPADEWKRARLHNTLAAMDVIFAVDCVITLATAGSLIYGVTKNKPNFLLPSICLTLMDIAGVVAGMVVGYYVHQEKIRRGVYPDLTGLRWFHGLELIVICIVGDFEIYMMYMTWKYFKYLRKLKCGDAERGLFQADDAMELLLNQEEVNETSEKNCQEPPVYQDHRYELSKHFTEAPEKTCV